MPRQYDTSEIKAVCHYYTVPPWQVILYWASRTRLFLIAFVLRLICLSALMALFAIQSGFFWQDVVTVLATFQGIGKSCISIACLLAIAECFW